MMMGDGTYNGVHHSAPQVGPRGEYIVGSHHQRGAIENEPGRQHGGRSPVLHPTLSLEGSSFCRAPVFFCRFVQHALLFLPQSYLLTSSRTTTYAYWHTC